MTAGREIGASETFRNAFLAMRCAGCDGPFTPKRKGQAHCLGELSQAGTRAAARCGDD